MWRRIPWTIAGCSALLMLLGLSGIARGDELFGRGVYFNRQLMWVCVSVPAMWLATWIPYRLLRRFSLPLFAGSLLLLIVVLVMPRVNGARSWIPLGFANFQPSELAKLTFVMALAHYLIYRDNFRRLSGLLVPFVLTCLPVGLILCEPDLGTALLFIPTLFAMLFAAGARPRHLASIVALGMLSSPLLWIGMNAEQRSRIVSLLEQKDSGQAPRGDPFQQHQSKRVLARGGVWGSEISGRDAETWICQQCAHWNWVPAEGPSGRGVKCSRCAHQFTISRRPDEFLPESRTDFVFCLIGERWGLIGCGLTLFLYIAVVASGLWIAQATQEPFGRLLAVGIVALFASQTIINTGMTVGLVPVTGITLPLLSYGGSSLVMTAIGMGLLLNVGMRPGYEVTGEPFRWRAAT